MQTSELILQHIVCKPKVNVDKAPMLILLHGQRGNERDYFEQVCALDERLLVASLRAPFALSANSHVWFHGETTVGGMLISPPHIEYSRQRIAKFIQKAPVLFDINPRQIYLMGYDQGAVMSLAVMMSEAASLAGVIAVCGHAVPEIRAILPAPEAIRNLPVMLVNGTLDESVPIAESRATRDYLLSYAVALNYRECLMGHHISQESLNEIRAWLKPLLDAAFESTSPPPAPPPSAFPPTKPVNREDTPAPTPPRRTTVPLSPLPYTTRLNRVHLKVRDLERAINFYTTFLGLRIVERVGNVYAFLTSSNLHHELALQRVAVSSPRAHPNSTGLHVVGFEVPDQVSFARAYRLLTESGIHVKTTDRIIGWTMEFTDPDGNGVEIYCDTRHLRGKADLWQGRDLPLEADKILAVLGGSR